MRWGIFGGSFDPPHRAHVEAVRQALASGEVDRVLVVPVFAHAFGKRLASFEHRLAMCELAFRDVAEPGRVALSRIEESLAQPNYTVHTLQALRAERPGATFRLMIGTDVLRDREKWYQFEEVERLAPPLVFGRVGIEVAGILGPELPEASSTEVRELLAEAAAGRRTPAQAERFRELVPENVRRYILEHGLYQQPPKAS